MCSSPKRAIPHAAEVVTYPPYVAHNARISCRVPALFLTAESDQHLYALIRRLVYTEGYVSNSRPVRRDFSGGSRRRWT